MTAKNVDQVLPEPAPEAGELVQVRSGRWLVEGVVSSAIQGSHILFGWPVRTMTHKGNPWRFTAVTSQTAGSIIEEKWHDLRASKQ